MFEQTVHLTAKMQRLRQSFSEGAKGAKHFRIHLLNFSIKHSEIA